jgi:hypothetical protein
VSKRKGAKGTPADSDESGDAGDLPTPHVILDALFPQPGRCGSTSLQPLRIAHYLALELVDSPLLDSPKSARNTSSMDIVQAMAILSLPAERVLDAMDLGGRPALERLARDFAAVAPIADIRDAALRVVEHCRKAFATILPGGGGGGADGPLSSSTVPPEAAPASAL